MSCRAVCVRRAEDFLLHDCIAGLPAHGQASRLCDLFVRLGLFVV